MMRYNTDSADFEIYNGSWAILAGVGGVVLSKLEDGDLDTRIFVENSPGGGVDDDIITFTMGDNSGTYVMPASVLEWSTAGFDIETPTGNAGNAGVGFTITTGDGNIAAAGGSIDFIAGDGGATGDGGNITLSAGAGNGGGSAGAVIIPDSIAPSSTTNKLYSVAGALTWNGTDISGGGGGGLNNVVEDLTPQLGGDLDVNGQNIISADGSGADGEPLSIIAGAGDVGFAGGDITISTSAHPTSGDGGSVNITAADGNGVFSLIQGQDETNYDNSPFNEGTFIGGDIFTFDDPGDIGETITLEDGTVITIDGFGSLDRVDEFTVTTVGAGFTGQFQLNQVSTTSSTGTGFLLRPEFANILRVDGEGGNFVATAGAGGGGGGGGNMTIAAGDSGIGSGEGGNLTIKSGDGAVYSGTLSIEVGTSFDASGRDLDLYAGNADYQGGDAFGGDVRILAGVGFATSGSPDNSYGGNIFIEAGPGQYSPGSNPDDGGAITIRSGSGVDFGGNITLQAGTGTYSGAIVIPTQVAPNTTTSKLYNVAGALTWDGTDLTAAGAGDVLKVGTPVDNQIGVWTGDGTIEGDANFTWDGSTLTINGAIAKLIEFETQTGTTFSAFTLAHSGVMVTMDNAGANTVTLPANGSVAYPIGTEIHFQQLGAGATTIAITTDTLNVNGNLTLVLNGQYAVATALKMTATTWTLFGNLVFV
jgi:hypothetical protein